MRVIFALFRRAEFWLFCGNIGTQILYVPRAALGAVRACVCVEWEEDVKYSVLSLDEPQQPWSGGFILTLQVIAGGALTKVTHHPPPPPRQCMFGD